ncbi:MAG: hypothetical protein COB76_05930, partial [Alphaproteobacteria bacterium]
NVSFKNRFYKIPISLSGIRLLRKEKDGHELAKSSPIFSGVRPTQDGCCLSLVRPFLKPANYELTERFLGGLLSGVAADDISLGYLLEEEMMQFLPSDVQKFIQNYKIKLSSAHCDLHQENIFEEDGRLVLIDWGGYRKSFWDRYDVIHYHFCNEIKGDEKLSDILAFPQEVIKKMNGKIDFDGHDLISYVVCRNVIESSQDRVISETLYKKRIQKYGARIQKVWEGLKL